MRIVTLEEARAAQVAALRPYGHLAAVGIARVGEDYCLNVNLREPLDNKTKIPSHVDGVPVNVRVVSNIRPL